MAIPKNLANSLSKGDVIPFVGAGVSLAVRKKNSGRSLFPSWRDLLFAAASYLRDQNKIYQAAAVEGMLLSDYPDYLEIANYCKEHLRTNWHPFLQKNLDPSRDLADESSLELAKLIWRIGSKLVITTNYDRVLFWTCPKAYDAWELDIETPAELAYLLQGSVDFPVIWHLHGHVRNKSNMVLTTSDYRKIYPGEKEESVLYPAALQTIQSLLTSKSFLFIGASMDDPYFTRQIVDIYNRFKMGICPHYILIKESEKERFLEKKLPVEYITFEDFGEPLTNLVADISRLTKGNSKTIYKEEISNHAHQELMMVNPLEKYFEFLTESGKYTEQTIVDYQRNLIYLEKFFNKPLTHLTEEELTSWWEEEQKKGYSPSTIIKKKDVLRAYFRFCLQNKYVKHDPTSSLSTIKKPEESYEYNSDSEIIKAQALLKSTNRIEVRNKAIFYTLLETGVLPFELRSLRFSDVNTKKRIVTVGKNKITREIPVSETLLLPLTEWLKVHPASDGFLFTSFSEPYPAISYDTVRRFIKELSKNAHLGSDGISCNKLRNRFIYSLIEKGFSIQEVKDLAGHGSLTTTERYFSRFKNENMRMKLSK